MVEEKKLPRKEALLKEQNKHSSEETEIPEGVKKANEGAALAEAEAKEIRAKKEVEAVKAGFTTVEEWEQKQAEFNKLVEETFAGFEKDRQAIEKDRLQNVADAEANALLQTQYKEGLKEIESGKVKIAQVYQDAQKEVKQDLFNFKMRVSGGVIGVIEEAARLLSQPLVKRAWVEYQCPDCHKDGSDGVDRVAHFDIPLLSECAPFGVCGDCEPDQVDTRLLPTYICDICPYYELTKRALKNIITGLEMAGIIHKFDTDGIYMPHIQGVKEGQVSPKEWIQKVLSDTQWSAKDVQLKQEKALGKLAPKTDDELELGDNSID